MKKIEKVLTIGMITACIVQSSAFAGDFNPFDPLSWGDFFMTRANEAFTGVARIAKQESAVAEADAARLAPGYVAVVEKTLDGNEAMFPKAEEILKNLKISFFSKSANEYFSRLVGRGEPMTKATSVLTPKQAQKGLDLLAKLEKNETITKAERTFLKKALDAARNTAVSDKVAGLLAFGGSKALPNFVTEEAGKFALLGAVGLGSLAIGRPSFAQETNLQNCPPSLPVVDCESALKSRELVVIPSQNVESAAAKAGPSAKDAQ